MDERKLIFSNLLNGVPLDTVAQVFHKTCADVQADFNYIVQKIKNYCFLNAVPAIHCESIEQARKVRHSIFPILEVINLDKSPIYKITSTEFNGELPL